MLRSDPRDYPGLVRDVLVRSTPPNLKAEALLREHLTRRQWWSLTKLGYFRVRGSQGRRYKIKSERQVNVTRTLAGLPIRRYCAVLNVRRSVPLADQLLTQKLMIEHDEQHFRYVAVEYELNWNW